VVDRLAPVAETLAVARSLRERYGITRIAETTRLDRIGIPTFSAIVPGSPDKLGVYNGKGLTRDAATAGALMEAIERQVCARFESMHVFGVPVRKVDGAIDVRACGWLGAIDGDVECVRGVNLIDGAEIAVPVGLVRCPRVGERRFERTTSNGLASGNTASEATYHALMELIERHLWSTVHILAHVWPRALRSRASVEIEQPDDQVASEVIDAGEHPSLAGLIRCIRDAGLSVRLLSYAKPEWPVAMMACVADPAVHELFYHLGFGCSWSPVHAAVRAILEAVQARATDVQGAREDIKLSADGEARPLDHGRRPSGFPEGGRWYFDGPARKSTLVELAGSSAPDVARDLGATVSVLRDSGQTCVAYVDLTPPGLPVSVVRVVAPHLERTLVDGSISQRMQTFLKNPLSFDCGASRLRSG
jgi:ribosomal protein S12 methylthiotransferase accessory factor